MRRRLGTTFQSLTVRNYRLFATGQLVKLLGWWMQVIAQDWLVLQLSGDSGTMLGFVTALQFTPFLLLTLYGGRLADRYDKRKLLIVINAMWCLSVAALAVLVTTGVVALWHVFMFAAAMGTVNALETPVRQSFVSELVGTTLLPNALALSSATFNSARITGPAIAGLIIAAFGTGPVFVASAICAASPLLSLMRMRPSELHRDALPPRAVRREASIVGGLRYVWRRPDLLLPLSMIGLIGAFGFNFNINLALLAKTTYRTSAAAFGLFSTVLAVGALMGALVGSNRRTRPSIYLVLGAAIAFAALETTVGLVSTYWLAVALLGLTGFSMIFFAQATNQRVQLSSDAAYRGRVMALYTLAFMGTTPLCSPVVGWVGEHFGARTSLWGGGLLSLAVAFVGLAVQLRSSGDRLSTLVRRLPWRTAKEPTAIAAPDATAEPAPINGSITLDKPIAVNKPIVAVARKESVSLR